MTDCEPGPNASVDCPERQYIRVRNLVAVLTTIFLIGSIAGLVAFQYNAENLLNDQILEQARAHGREFEAVRLYVSSFGGIYIPASEEETVNPHLLGVPDREASVETSAGRTLVLRNSPLVAASVSRLMQGLDAQQSVVLRMASERPLNASNRPDPFEGAALAAFRADPGVKERWQFEPHGVETHFRYAFPILVKKPCVACHPDVANEIGRPFAVTSVSLDVTSAVDRTHKNRRWILVMILVVCLTVGVGLRMFVLRTMHNLRDSQRRLFELARTDALTGLANSRLGLARLTEELARHKREGEGLAVAMLDLDDFKRVNDTLGHAAGDEALRVAADALRGQARLYDVVARTGGEEFLLIMAGVDVERAVAATERVRASLSAALRAALPELPALGASAGVTLARDGDTEHDVLSRADTAMYEAKRAGKNRTYVL